MMHLFVFIFSICIGSFLNVLICRLPIHEDFVVKRSYCPNCKHELEWCDLIPILSYILLKGRCRYCKNKISLMYIFIELLAGCVGVLCYIRYGFRVLSFLHFLVLAILIVISIIDMKIMEIPDECNFAIVVLSLIQIFMFNEDLIDHIFYAFIIVLFIWILNRIKLSFGGGDMKLFFALGLYFGKYVFLIFILSVLLGGIYGIGMLVMKKLNRKSFIPFAPCITMACFIYIFQSRYILALFR